MIIRELVHLRELNLVRTFCYSMDLDGMNEYIETPVNAAYDLEHTDSMSFEGWVKFNTIGTYNIILSKWTNTLGNGRGIHFMAFGTELRLDLQNNGGFSSLIVHSIGANILAGVWYHLAVTYDGSNTVAGIKFYKNGILIPINSAVHNNLVGTITNTRPVTLGAVPLGGVYTDELINTVRWWDVELTPTEILYQYNNRTGIPSQPLSLILNTDIDHSIWNGSEYDIPDLTGITTGYTTVNAEIEDRINDCPIILPCYSMSLDGVNEYIEAPINAAYDLDGTDAMSFEFWVKFDTISTSLNRLFRKYGPVASQGIMVFTGTRANPSLSQPELRFDLQANGGLNGLIIFSSGANITIPNIWYHFMITYDGSQAPSGVKMYKNGLPLAMITNSNTLSNPITNTATVKIGGDGFNTNGLFNKARWWDVELTAGEVLTQYNSGYVLDTPVQAASLIFDTDMTNSIWNGSEYDIPDLTGITAGYTTVNAEEEDRVADCPIIPCYSMDLDGVNEYIEAPINAAFDLDRLDPMSFECWVKFDSFDPTIDHLFSKYQFGLGVAFSIFGNQLRFDLQNNGTTNRITKYAVGTTIVAGVWYHLAATYDGSSSASGVKMYVNSVEVSYGFTVDGLTGSILNAQPVRIGAAPAIGFYSNALYNTFRWWKTELSQAEITYQFNNRLGIPSQSSNLILNLDINSSTWNGSEYDISDLTGITAGYTTVNAEEADKIEDCP